MLFHQLPPRTNRREPACAHDEAPREPSPAAETAMLRRELAQARAALAAAEERERTLRFELQHRVRNVLAVIRSIYRRSCETSGDRADFAEHFQGRLDAVGRYHALVDAVGARGLELGDMIRNEFLNAQVREGPDCTIDGPPVRLHAKSAELMGLAMHELATNSIKFGALARRGRVTIGWSVETRADAPLLCFRWSETGSVPIVAAPRTAGFGRRLIEEALPYELGATTSFRLRPGGFECVVRLPLPGGHVLDDPDFAADDDICLLPSEEGRTA